MNKVLPISKKIVGKRKHKSLKESFFDNEGHLNQSGITLYVEARLLEREDELPESIQTHAQECAKCQEEILEFYEFMQEEDISGLTPHSFLDRNSANRSAFGKMMWKFTSSASRVAAVVLFAVASCLGYLLVSEPYSYTESSIISPFENPRINTAYQTWDIESSQGQSLLMPNGSYLHIPSSIFVDKLGKSIKGKVTLKYRELRKASELIASGIPLQLSRNGQAQASENAGTFEIRGFQEGEPVYIKSGKYVSVNMTSDFSEDDFANYYLDENPQKALSINTPLASNAFAEEAQAEWIYQQKSKTFYSTNLAEQNKNRLALRKNSLDSLGKEIQRNQRNLTPPISEKTHGYQDFSSEVPSLFTLSFNTNENPDLLPKQEIVWKFMGENKSISPTQDNKWILNEKWDEINLSLQKYKPLSLKGHLGAVNDAQFSQDGTRILTASDDQTIKVWSSEAQYLFTLKGHSGAVNTAVFSPKNNEYILSASNDRTAKIWSKQGNLITTLQGHEAAVNSATFSADGNYILTCSNDNTARLWNYRGQALHSFPHLKSAGKAQISPNSRLILSVSSDSLQLWNTKGEKVIQILGQFSSAKFSHDGRYLLTTSANTSTGKAQLWNLKGELLKSFNLNDGNIIFSPDDMHIISVNGYQARLWYLNPAKSYNTVLIRNMYNGNQDQRNAHSNAITAIEYAQQDGKDYIITASQDHTAKIWSGDGKVLHTLREHSGKLNSAVISPTKDQILTASDDFTAKLWIEREIKDVFEMLLVKKEKILKDDRGVNVRIEGKRFYTVVKEAKMQDYDDSWQTVETPKLDNNPLNQMLDRYEQLVEEIKFLESQRIPKMQLLLRSFKVTQFGFYACQRYYQNPNALEYESSFSFEKATNAKKAKLYHITGKQETVIIPIEHLPNQYSLLRFSLNLPNKILAILPNDRVAMYGKERFGEIDFSNLKSKPHLNFELLPSFPVKSIEEFDKFVSKSDSQEMRF